MNEKTMFKLTCGLFVLTARKGDKDNYTHDMIFRTGKFHIPILSDVPCTTYTYCQSHIKLASAPAKGKTVWRCNICGCK